MIPLVVLGIGLLLAFANGANDTFKGVATLHGSRVASYRTALAWAVVTTLAGAVASLFLVEGLVRIFSGKGLVDVAVMSTGRFPAVVAMAAGLTVLSASALRMPVSTTHALVGALSGVALVTASGWGWLLLLGAVFFLPLLVSPLVSMLLAWLANRWTAAPASRCVCAATVATPEGTLRPVTVVGSEAECSVHGARPIVTSSRLLDGVHFLSAGAVGFSRGLNDTPKLLGVLVAGGLFTADVPLVLMVGLAMALGGLVWSRPIARTMGERLTPMSPAQGTASNLVTAVIVGAASLAAKGLPVSTTHVSCGSIFGLGAARRELSRRWAGAVAVSWLFTLPVAGSLAGGLWYGLGLIDA